MGKGPEQTLLPRGHANGQQICEKNLNLTTTGETQITTAMRCPLAAVRQTSSNQPGSNKWCWGCGEKEPSPLLEGMQTGAATVEDSVRVLQK